MKIIINRKLGETKGLPRLWLQGECLASGGFSIGDKIEVEAAANRQIILKPASEKGGRYTVSKRSRNNRVIPVLDVTARELAELFDGLEYPENGDKILRVMIQEKRIIVTVDRQHIQQTKREQRLAKKVKEGAVLDVASLFHGGGILDAAFHQGMKDAGVNTRLAVAIELEPEYLDCSMRNNPVWDANSIAINSPIEQVSPYRSGMEVDVLLAGIPCTGASRSGRSKNGIKAAEEHDKAGAMFVYFLEFVRALNPAVVLVENVPEYANTLSATVIRSVLDDLGYRITEKVLNGNDFGALENRNRLCMVAVSEGLPDVDLDSLSPVRQKESTISEILEDVPDSSERWKSFDYLAEKEKRDLAAGKGFKRQLLDGSEPCCGTIGKDYAKCRSTEPFIKNPRNPRLSRIFTPREHARVKTIPDYLLDGCSDTTAHQIMGQSVIFVVFQAVGRLIGSLLRQTASPQISVAA